MEHSCKYMIPHISGYFCTTATNNSVIANPIQV